MATRKQTQFRKSTNGRFTTKKYAEKHPDTTEKEVIRHPAKD